MYARNHRERKENYIKSLEREVLRLRDEEAAVAQESKAVQDENAMLKEILTRNGIPIPSRTSTFNPLATVSVLDQVDGLQRLQVTMPEPMDFSQTTFDPVAPPFPSSMSTSSPESMSTAVPMPHPSPRDMSSHVPSLSPISGIVSTSQGDSPTAQYEYISHPSGLDAPQIGIDFVLSLEQPCLGHTRSDPHSGEPSGHALTAQAPLLTAAPTSLSPSKSWQIPAIEIERLLELSAQLNLLDEVTPVQAWSRIRSAPGFEKLSRDTLDGLKFALMAEVQCYG